MTIIFNTGKMRKITISLMAFLFAFAVNAQLKEFPCTPEWVQKIEKIAPEKPSAQPKKERKILIFDKFTGFNHWVIPHATAVIRVVGEKSGAYKVDVVSDLSFFETKTLKKYDAVVLNNNCSVGPRRNQILDMLDEDKSLTEEQKIKMAAEFENNLIDYVKKGGGLMIVHGAIVMQNNSLSFSVMVGGSFDYHPPQQKITLEPAEAGHPLLEAFEGKSFVHIDEPYLFKNAYIEKNFRPLLYMDTDKLTNKPKPIDEKIKYVSWIKRFGKGRVFYVSPSHNAQSYEDARLLKYYLNGAQYVLGDLKCDDSPLKINNQ
jgi:type 1 glutamine amidotransferase